MATDGATEYNFLWSFEAPNPRIAALIWTHAPKLLIQNIKYCWIKKIPWSRSTRADPKPYGTSEKRSFENDKYIWTVFLDYAWWRIFIFLQLDLLTIANSLMIWNRPVISRMKISFVDFHYKDRTQISKKWMVQGAGVDGLKEPWVEFYYWWGAIMLRDRWNFPFLSFSYLSPWKIAPH